MFAALTIERDPLRWEDLPTVLEGWLQSAGGYAMIGLVLWFVFGLPRVRGSDYARISGWRVAVFLISLIGAGLGYLALLLPRMPGRALAELAAMGSLGVVAWALVNRQSLFGQEGGRVPLWQAPVFMICSLAVCFSILYSIRPSEVLFLGAALEKAGNEPLKALDRKIFDVASGFALMGVAVPFLASLFGCRSRRIFAIAKLSFKEAVRRRVLYAFSGLLLVFLFASWFLSSKPEDEVRSYVQVVYKSTTLLLLFTASILAGFSIPTDIRQLTIHTVVTKPVERFEIVLGRFLGFTALMTVILVLMTSLSMLYVIRGVGPDAAAESLKARDPVYGGLYFLNTAGESVGREWEYRKYITAASPGQDPPLAIWGFAPLTGAALDRERVRCEFTFDIYRTTKGEENKGIFVFLTFHTGHYDRGRENDYRFLKEEARRWLDAGPPQLDPQLDKVAERFPGLKEKLEDMKKRGRPSELDGALAEAVGFFEVPSKSIDDFHTQAVDVPAAILRRALKEPPSGGDANDPATRPLQVRVKCLSRTQYIGVAKYDLYFRQDDPESGADKALFAANFYKGAMGLWYRLCIMIGVAVCLSTYLSGVISMFLALLLYLGGVCQEFVQSVANAKNIGGGPTESLIRLIGNEHISYPRDPTIGQKVAEKSDAVFRWVLRRVLDLLPDVDRFDLTNFVAEGFNISAAQLTLDVLLLLGYLLPWFVLGYFVMKWREIATW